MEQQGTKSVCAGYIEMPKEHAVAYLFLSSLFGILVAVGYAIMPSKSERIAMQEFVIADLRTSPVPPQNRKIPNSPLSYQTRAQEIREAEEKLEAIKAETGIGKFIFFFVFCGSCLAWAVSCIVELRR